MNLVLLAWQAEESFEETTEICEKCRCTSEGPEFILDCKNTNLEHMIANWPEHNTRLIATFSYNNISHLEMLPSSPLVRKVIISHCGIKTIDSGTFEATKFVSFIDLSYNLLTTEEISPDKFKGPYNNTTYEPLLLEDLNLAYNHIHSLPHNIFEHVSTLKQLNLEGNHFRVLDSPTQLALSSVKELEVLNLAGNELTELVGDAIRNLQKLRILNLSKNKLDFVPNTLNLLSNSLETVYLDFNPIYMITDESFLGVKGIRTLSLTNLAILRYVGPNVFSPLQNLSVLYLSDNQNLTSIDRDAFGPDQLLEELYINDNSLQDLHYNLTRWTSLKSFKMNGNDLYCDCNLYQIAQDLTEQIKANKDGPVCLNPINDISMMVYNLTQESCLYKRQVFRLSHVIEHHFRAIKFVFTILLGVAVLTTFGAVLIAFLRYRRQRMNRNYPFVAQVTYNPLRNSSVN